MHASGPRKVTPQVLARAVELHRQGHSWPSIAAELGCHRQSLYFARKRSISSL
ncbi:MAG: helix-turn-helix domain-containing protein [Thermoguttaceae bacterium]